MLEVTFDGKPDNSRALLKRLGYGTLVMLDVQPGVVYIKVNATKTGRGLSVYKTRHHSVLCNVKLGTIREVSADTEVTIVEATGPLNVVKADATDYYR